MNVISTAALESGPKIPSVPRRKCRRGIRRVAPLRGREHCASVASFSAAASFEAGAVRSRAVKAVPRTSGGFVPRQTESL